MLQTVDGRDDVFVVDFDAMPELPITWNTNEEKPYALALAHAIQTGQITKPGKYGIIIDPPVDAAVPITFSIYTITE